MSRSCWVDETQATSGLATHLEDLNAAQRMAAVYGIGKCDAPDTARALLVIAGAGTGKTKTLSHRVAHLILNGAHPQRILLLTFARRMAVEMTRRVERICATALKDRRAVSNASNEWSG